MNHLADLSFGDDVLDKGSVNDPQRGRAGAFRNVYVTRGSRRESFAISGAVTAHRRVRRC